MTRARKKKYKKRGLKRKMRIITESVALLEVKKIRHNAALVYLLT